jgi:hypothetical protein
MASSANAFRQHLGSEVSRLLGDDWRFFKSQCQLRAATPDGHNVIVLSGSSQFSPYIDIEFYFGRNFAAAKQLEKLLGGHQAIYHILLYSRSRQHMQGLAYTGPDTWPVDLSCPPDGLASEVAAAARGMAFPFFERFADIGAARDALAHNDPWCFGGDHAWRSLLLLDAAMGDLQHFKDWSAVLDDFQRKQADEEVARIEQIL